MYSIKLTTAAEYKRYAHVTHIHSEYDTAFGQLIDATPLGIFEVDEEEQADGSIIVHFKGHKNIARLVHTWVKTAMKDQTFDFYIYDDPKSWQFILTAKVRAWASGIDYDKLKEAVGTIYDHYQSQP